MVVHYVSTDGAFAPPAPLALTRSFPYSTRRRPGDGAITIGGHNGVKETGNFLNVKDLTYTDGRRMTPLTFLVGRFTETRPAGRRGNLATSRILTGCGSSASPSGARSPSSARTASGTGSSSGYPTTACEGRRRKRFVGSVPEPARSGQAPPGGESRRPRFRFGGGCTGLIVRVGGLRREGRLRRAGRHEPVRAARGVPGGAPRPTWSPADIAAARANHLEVN